MSSATAPWPTSARWQSCWPVWSHRALRPAPARRLRRSRSSSRSWKTSRIAPPCLCQTLLPSWDSLRSHPEGSFQRGRRARVHRASEQVKSVLRVLDEVARLHLAMTRVADPITEPFASQLLLGDMGSIGENHLADVGTPALDPKAATLRKACLCH
ncbi:hypothetical protein BC834DRAFT_329936 [Gloeopeniophorella convolvens]|nr:hypothetical protein BC834DRAFT_329936 [Gloeopeniophorella convolvens]